MPLCPSQSRHRPELLWHRSSFGSNDSVESAIQDDGDDEDEEMIVSPASAEHPVKVSHPPSLLFRSLQPPRLSPSSAPPPFLTHLETSSVFFSLSLDVSLSAPFHSSQPSNQRQPSLEFITSLNVSNTHTGMCYPRVTSTHPTSTWRRPLSWAITSGYQNETGGRRRSWETTCLFHCACSTFASTLLGNLSWSIDSKLSPYPTPRSTSYSCLAAWTILNGRLISFVSPWPWKIPFIQYHFNLISSNPHS